MERVHFIVKSQNHDCDILRSRRNGLTGVCSFLNPFDFMSTQNECLSDLGVDDKNGVQKYIDEPSKLFISRSKEW